MFRQFNFCDPIYILCSAAYSFAVLFSQCTVQLSHCNETSSRTSRYVFASARVGRSFQNSPLAHCLLNRPVNHRFEAPSHLSQYLRFLVESWPARTWPRARATTSSFPPLPCWWCCFSYSLFAVSELTWCSSLLSSARKKTLGSPSGNKTQNTLEENKQKE